MDVFWSAFAPSSSRDSLIHPFQVLWSQRMRSNFRAQFRHQENTLPKSTTHHHHHHHPSFLHGKKNPDQLHWLDACYWRSNSNLCLLLYLVPEVNTTLCKMTKKPCIFTYMLNCGLGFLVHQFHNQKPPWIHKKSDRPWGLNSLQSSRQMQRSQRYH